MRPDKWLVAAGLAATSIVVAVPASAKVLYNEVDEDVVTVSFPAVSPVPDPDFEPLCEGLDLEAEFSFRDRISFVQRGPGTVPYFHGRFHSTDVWTNLDTGKTATVHNRVNDKDLVVVDNGDGTITIDALATGGFRITDDDGRQRYSDAGQIRYRVVIDLMGTPLDPSDDEELSFEVTRESNGTNDTAGTDFCDILAELTGP